METLWMAAADWFLGLGDNYGVNPIVFGSIYVGAIPLFALSVAWIARAKQKGKSLIWPTVSAAFWFVSSYLYLFIAGENIPWWVYALILVVVLYAAAVSYRGIRSKISS